MPLRAGGNRRSARSCRRQPTAQTNLYGAREFTVVPNGGRRPGAGRRDELECGGCGQPSTVPVMLSDKFVPVGFNPLSSLVTHQFRLEPLGPQHN
jgi:hypothetical protein